jgi:hypothetical protein
MFRHRERMVKVMVFFLAGAMVLSLVLPYLSQLF